MPIMDDVATEMKTWTKSELSARHGWRWEVQNSQQKKIQTMQEMDVTFKSSDEDKDGLLNLSEYKDFIAKMKSNTEAKGLRDLAITDERTQRYYEALNSITPETEGISINDYLMGFSIMQTIEIEQQENH